MADVDINDLIGLFGNSSDFADPAVDAVGGSSDSILAALNGIPQSAVQGGGGLLSGLVDWAKANPQLAGALFGASGPLAGLLGNIGAGGISGTTSGSQSGFQSGSSSGSTSGSSTQNLSGSRTEDSSRTDSGFQNQTTTPTIDPAAQAAMDRLDAMLSRNDASAQGAHDQGLSMLQQLATGAMEKFGQGAGGYAQPTAPNTTPTPTATGNFPGGPPIEYNAGIGNLIKQAFGSFVGDLGGQAITNARSRGFAGGADLLNSAAAPMMGQSLAQVPAMEAKAYLDHVLQAYDLESQNAGRVSAANAAAMNAGTNALGPGVTKYGMDVQKYGIDRTADTNQLAGLTSLLNSLMGPQRDLMTGNQNLLTGAPRGSTSNSLSGGTTNQSLSGTNQSLQQNQNQSQTQNQSQSQSGGTTSGQTATPMGNVIGQGAANIIGGAGAGAVAGGPPPAASGLTPAQRTSLLALLGQK